MKVLRKSMAGLISAGTILCACPQTYAKTESNGQRILNGAKAVGKYVAPVGTALVIGLIGGAGYRKYQGDKPKKSYGKFDHCNAKDFAAELSGLHFWETVEKNKPILRESFLIHKLLDNKECICKQVSLKKDDNILFIEGIDGNIQSVKEMLERAVVHIIEKGGKVVLPGNILSKSNIKKNLECIITIMELKYKFPSNVLIFKNDNEKEVLKDLKKFIPMNGSKNLNKQYLDNIRGLIEKFITSLPDIADRNKYITDSK